MRSVLSSQSNYTAHGWKDVFRPVQLPPMGKSLVTHGCTDSVCLHTCVSMPAFGHTDVYDMTLGGVPVGHLRTGDAMGWQTARSHG